MNRIWGRRAGGTIPGHDIRSTAAMVRLAQTHVDLAHRVALQTRKTVVLTRWVIALSIITAITGGAIIAALLFQ